VDGQRRRHTVGLMLAKRSDMTAHRAAYAALLTTLVASATTACGGPGSDRSVGDSASTLVGGEETPPVFSSPNRFNTFGVTRFNPRLVAIEENVRIKETGDAARVCYAYLDGTEEQKRACDQYPTNYFDMSCSDQPTRFIGDSFGGELGREVSTQCLGQRKLGEAPLDQGDGRYQAHFVSVKTPSVTTVHTPVVATSDLFTIIVPSNQQPFSFVPSLDRQPGYSDSEIPVLFPYGVTGRAFPGLGFPAPQPFARFSVNFRLAFTVEVRRDLARQVKACATTYAAEGLSNEEIDAKDAEAVAACATPNVLLSELPQWQTTEGVPDADRAQLTTDATALLAPNRRIAVAFEVAGRVRAIIFSLVAGGRVLP